VALPMDEQRILEEMERMLVSDDPRLAARLAAFGQPGVGHVLRTRRGQATMSLLVLAMIASVAAIIYLFSALRDGAQLPVRSQHSSASAQPADPVSANQPVPVTGRAHCVVLVTPKTCTAWSASGGTAGNLSAGATRR
jgi:Protein of unknown function (DUF3040)